MDKSTCFLYFFWEKGHFWEGIVAEERKGRGSFIRTQVHIKRHAREKEGRSMILCFFFW